MIGDHSGIHLHLRSTALKKLPSSIFHLKDLQHFSFPISESLMDLPTNFAFQISLSDPLEHKYDTAITLHKVLPSPVFQSVVRVVFDNCCSLTEIPESFSLLSSLAHLNLYRCINVRTLPQSLKCLPRLEVLNIFQSDMLELLPMLPPSLKRLRVWNCKLLKTVLSTISEPTRKDEATFLFLNCNNLDEDSYGIILKDVIVRTELVITPSSSGTEFENQEEERFFDCYTYFGEICYLLPVRGSNIHDLFDVHSTEEATYKLSVEVPRDSNLVGFLLFIVVSEEQWSCIEEHTWYNVGDLLGFGCECSLETSWGEKVHTESFSLLQWHWDQFYHHLNITSDHALLWYDEKRCKKIMEAIRGRKGKDMNDEKGSTSTCNNANLTLEFFAGVVNKLDAVIQECGIRWIYQNVEEEEGPRGRKSKRSSEESYEEEGSESNDDEQEESSIPPTKKFKQSLLEPPLILDGEEVVEDWKNLKKSCTLDLIYGDSCDEEKERHVASSSGNRHTPFPFLPKSNSPTQHIAAAKINRKKEKRGEGANQKRGEGGRVRRQVTAARRAAVVTDDGGTRRVCRRHGELARVRSVATAVTLCAANFVAPRRHHRRRTAVESLPSHRRCELLSSHKQDPMRRERDRTTRGEREGVAGWFLPPLLSPPSPSVELAAVGVTS
ncbi:uncharacterized protein LOC107614899 [Arachis ipaensis]|uniref:uncharacterized protein LOC107614899 n=1 Tax=Arachis ipaensis TaxID=130454 RepID=UPI0007AF9BE1|nr:uncharacterized protein LOC107614899 [Arachis ipaensis]